MIPPLTTTLDELRSEIRGQITNAYYDCRNEGETMETAADRAADSVMEVLAAQPAPPAEALRLLRELVACLSTATPIRGDLAQTLREARRYLASTEEGS